MAYVGQQHLDGYDNTVRHALKRKAVFDRKVRKRTPREVIFSTGELVQVYRSDTDYSFKALYKLLPKWSKPHRILERISNSYRLESLEGVELKGLYHARRIRSFVPRQGTRLNLEQEEFREGLRRMEEKDAEWEDIELVEGGICDEEMVDVVVSVPRQARARRGRRAFASGGTWSRDQRGRLRRSEDIQP